MKESAFDLHQKRPIWLTTLADLALLLLGFFVLVQAMDAPTRGKLAEAFRAGFGAPADMPTKIAPSPMALETARVSGFASGSADLPSDLRPLIGWAQAAAQDPRVRISIVGHAQSGEPNATLLAYDRARAVAGRLVAAGGISADRIEIMVPDPDGKSRREVTLEIGFGGNRQPVAGARQ